MPKRPSEQCETTPPLQSLRDLLRLMRRITNSPDFQAMYPKSQLVVSHSIDNDHPDVAREICHVVFNRVGEKQVEEILAVQMEGHYALTAGSIVLVRELVHKIRSGIGIIPDTEKYVEHEILVSPRGETYLRSS